MRHREVTQLKRADQQELLQREKAHWRDFKTKIARKLQHDDSVKRDVEMNLRLLATKASP